MSHLNIYKHAFKSTCPINGSIIDYKLTIKSLNIIKVEDIVSSCIFDARLHEDIADILISRLGGRQTIVAIHGGVKIKTKRNRGISL